MAFKMKGWSPFTKKEEKTGSAADEAAKMATVAAATKGAAPKYKSALKQSTGAATVTKSDGTKVEYPPVGYLGQEEYASVLASLPGSVFKDGENTGDVDDVDRDAYSKYLGGLGKTDGDDD